MDHTKEILGIVSIYCARTGLSRATVATQVMNDGKFFDRIENGGGFTMKTYERVKSWFAGNMPLEKPKRSASKEQHSQGVNT